MRSRKSGKRNATTEVLATEQVYPPKRPNPQGNDSRRQWCLIHKTNAHSLEECLVLKKALARQMAAEKGKRVRVVKVDTEVLALDNELIFSEFDLHVTHIFGGSMMFSSKREYKKVEHEVCSASQGTTTKMKWSHQKIKFSDADHPTTTTIPGKYPIVVEPTIRNIKIARVLIDGGSSINLLFASTLDEMGIP